MQKNEAVYVLAAGMVVDRAEFSKLGVQEMNEALGAIRCNAGIPLRVVASAEKFFTPENLISFIETKNPDYRLIAQQAGLNLNPDQVAAMQLAAQAKAGILNNMKKVA